MFTPAREQNPAYVLLFFFSCRSRPTGSVVGAFNGPSGEPAMTATHDSARDARRGHVLELVSVLEFATVADRLEQSGVDQPLWQWLDAALTHASWMPTASRAAPRQRPRNYEQLEFFGDAVLRLVASDYLLDKHPGLSVGQLSSIRAQLVSDRLLAQLGESLGLWQLMRIGPQALADPSARPGLLAAATEALIGALELACRHCDVPAGPLLKQWLGPFWAPHCQAMLADPQRDNWKSALQEWSQGVYGSLPQYISRERSSSHGDPERFEARVSLAGRTLGDGRGPSRKLAEQAAARAALRHIH